MKQGAESLTALAQELDRQQKSKRDFLAPTATLEVAAGASGAPLDLTVRGAAGAETFPMTRHAARQLQEWVPRLRWDFLEASLDAVPEQTAALLNGWLVARAEDRMVRTLDGGARAFLSSSYRVIDHYPVLEAALGALHRSGAADFEVHSQAVTEERLYLKVVFPGVAGEVRPGETVSAALVLSNSEIGSGACKLESMVYVLVCRNGMVSDRLVGRTHVGRRESAGADFAAELSVSVDTQRKMNAALLGLVADGVDHAMSHEAFGRVVARLRAAAELEIVGSPTKAVEVAADRFGFTEPERDGVLEHLLRGGDLTAWGLSNAVTRHSQDVESYDRASELERTGGRVVELRPEDWVEIGAAGATDHDRSLALRDARRTLERVAA